MKILVVPMHASIGVAAFSYMEEKKYDRIIMVHPWSKKGSENANAEHLREHFIRRLTKKSLKKRSYMIPEIEIIAMDCSQKPLEIATNFEYIIKRDVDKSLKSQDIHNPLYHILLVEESPSGYLIGSMSLSGDGYNINCLIGSIGYDIRKPKIGEFKPDENLVESFEQIPLLGHIQDAKDWLGNKSGTRRVLREIYSWYREEEDWEKEFRTIDISDFTDLSQQVISTHVTHMFNLQNPLIESLGKHQYRITRLGRSIGSSLSNNQN